VALAVFDAPLRFPVIRLHGVVDRTSAMINAKV